MEIKVLYEEMLHLSKKLSKVGFDDVIYILKKLTSKIEKLEKENTRLKRAIRDQNQIIDEQIREISILKGDLE